MDNISDGAPLFPIRHEDHSLSTSCSFDHRLRMTAGVNSRLSINQLLDGLSRVQPDKCRCAGRCSEDLTVFLSPPLDKGNDIVLHLIQGLVDYWPPSDMWRKMCSSRVTSPIPEQSIDGDKQEEDLTESDFRIHKKLRNARILVVYDHRETERNPVGCTCGVANQRPPVINGPNRSFRDRGGSNPSSFLLPTLPHY
jgi:hypothetical protein